jgi:hypothetical protein
MQNGRVEKLHGSPLLRHVDIIADPELLVKLGCVAQIQQL